MGFHKRHINEMVIRSVYNTNGYEGLIKLITNPDALFINDEISEAIVGIILDNKIEVESKESSIKKILKNFV
jgi:hypothetical protein